MCDTRIDLPFSSVGIGVLTEIMVLFNLSESLSLGANVRTSFSALSSLT